jgi:hypothetical protein
VPIPVFGDTRPGRKRAHQVTDTHLGSKFCDEKALLENLHKAPDRGATIVVSTGDVVDGVNAKLQHEQREIGFDGQVKRLIRLLKKAPKVPWVAIGGNHDAYADDAVGMESGLVIESRMRDAGIDWTYLGSCLGRAVIHGAKWELWHPHGSGTTRNSVRRLLNSRAETYLPEDRPDVLAIGHFHKHCSVYSFPEQVFCTAGGTFQRKGSTFSDRILNAWDIGSSIVSWTLRQDGTVGEFACDFMEAPRAGIGW